MTSILHLGPVRPRHETIRRFDDPPVPPAKLLAGMGHGTVSTPNNKGEVFVDPFLALNVAMLSTRRRAHVFPGRPGPGFSPPAVTTIITRRVSPQVFPSERPPQQ